MSQGQRKESSNPFSGRWAYVESNKPKWWELTHVDIIWSVAQNLQRSGVLSDIVLMDMAKRDPGRCIWPVGLARHPVQNVASSDVVTNALPFYPWVDSGLQWKGTMVFKERLGEDGSALIAASSKPGEAPAKGQTESTPSSSWKGCRVILHATASSTAQCFDKGIVCWRGGIKHRQVRDISVSHRSSCKGPAVTDRAWINCLQGTSFTAQGGFWVRSQG